MPRPRFGLVAAVAMVVSTGMAALAGGDAGAQENSGSPPVKVTDLPNTKVGGSSNIHLIAHVPLGGFFRVADSDLEQELSRPYAYIAQTRDRIGFTIIDLHDLKNVKVLYRWQIENMALHFGLGALRPKYFKLNGRYYVALCTQFMQGTPDADVGAIIFDVTGLPDTSKVKEVARIRYPAVPGGFHNLFPYKHSDGRVLLFATTNSSYGNVYDMEKLLSGDKDQGLIDTIPVPQGNVHAEFYPGYGMNAWKGFHDFYVAYDPATHQDKFYGPGGGGYYIYDVTNIGREPAKMLTSIVGAAGITTGHTFTPTPDGKYAVTETEYQWAPLRIFDLQPGLEGKIQTIAQPIAVWNWDWNDLVHNHEVRWPFVFVSGYEDGLEVFNMQDPYHPRTVGWYYTCDCNHMTGYGGLAHLEDHSIYNGAEGVMVRNTDGLILISDWNTGAWFFKMDGFDHWNGEDWGMPNISSAQDWDHGPPGAPAVTAQTLALRAQVKTISSVRAAAAAPAAVTGGAPFVSVNVQVQNNIDAASALSVFIMQRFPESGKPVVLGDVPPGQVKTFSFNTEAFGAGRPANQNYRLTANAAQQSIPLVSTDFTLNTTPPTDTVIWSVRDGSVAFRMHH